MDTPLGIIGTAGRGSDREKLCHSSYDRMLTSATTLITHLKLDPRDICGVSGGAAWADHLIVTLGVRRGIDPTKITLYLPSTLGPNGFIAESAFAQRTADTANYYHRLFSEVTGMDSIRELHLLQEAGATLIPGNGSFHARNAQVAKHLGDNGFLVAYTFGSETSSQPEWTIRPCGVVDAETAELKDGGTAHTWNLATCSKYHCRLGQMS